MPEKDIDCCTSSNQGGLITGTQKFNSCCCLAILRILEEINVDLQGANVLIIGSSLGKLIALNLLQRNSTVLLCNEFTVDLAHFLKEFEIIIAVSGVPHLIISACQKITSPFGISLRTAT